jgi:ATP-dependent Clp protease ATP-binding subunit ClpA
LGSYADGYVSFPPEIINRFSEIVVFEPLSGEAKRAIAELSLMRLAAQFGLEVESISPGAVDFLLSHCSEENEARSYEYAAERLFGKFLAEYDEGSLIRIGRNACGPRQIFVQSVSARDEE